jgi:RNA polymerase sigma-70 factor (ECF subfamily)
MIESEVLEAVAVEADDARLTRLFDTHYGRLFRLARRLSSDSAEAQDLVQETFVRLAVARRIPTGERSEEAWLIRVLVNLCRDRWRRAKVRQLVSLDGTLASSSPESAYASRLLVQQALATLPARRRAIVVMHQFEDLDTAAIARLLGITSVTVRWHLSRARKELARVLAATAEPRGGSDRKAVGGRRS